MNKLSIALTIAASLACASPARAQFSDRYAIWKSDKVTSETQIAQNCLGAYAAIQQFPYLTTLFEQDGNDLTGFEPDNDVFVITAKALPLKQDDTQALVTMLALQIGKDLVRDKNLFRHVGVAREVFSIVSECQTHFAIPSTVRFAKAPPARVPTDRECGVRYATLLHFNTGQIGQAIFTTRAQHAAQMVKQANPDLSEQQIFLDIDQAGRKAAARLTIGSAPNLGAVHDAYENIAACDAKYGFVPVPVPDGPAQMLDKRQNR